MKHIRVLGMVSVLGLVSVLAAYSVTITNETYTWDFGASVNVESSTNLDKSSKSSVDSKLEINTTFSFSDMAIISIEELTVDFSNMDEDDKQPQMGLEKIKGIVMLRPTTIEVFLGEDDDISAALDIDSLMLSRADGGLLSHDTIFGPEEVKNDDDDDATATEEEEKKPMFGTAVGLDLGMASVRLGSLHDNGEITGAFMMDVNAVENLSMSVNVGVKTDKDETDISEWGVLSNISYALKADSMTIMPQIGFGIKNAEQKNAYRAELGVKMMESIAGVGFSLTGFMVGNDLEKITSEPNIGMSLAAYHTAEGGALIENLNLAGVVDFGYKSDKTMMLASNVELSYLLDDGNIKPYGGVLVELEDLDETSDMKVQLQLGNTLQVVDHVSFDIGWKTGNLLGETGDGSEDAYDTGVESGKVKWGVLAVGMTFTL